MFGTEYNWLISHTQSDDGLPPRVRMAGTGMITIMVAVFCVLTVALRAEPPHLGLMRQAADARSAGDSKLFISKLEAARDLRPDYPRIVNNLARAYATVDRADDALGQLKKLAAMGIFVDIAADKPLASLHSREDFLALVKTFAANKAAVIGDSPSEKNLTLPGVDGILESLATHPVTGERFFGDVRNRCIWTRLANAKPGDTLVKFSRDSDALVGVFAVKIDASTNTLWAACSALPEMKGYTDADQGRAFLAVYDLATRTLVRRHALPADATGGHVLGDFAFAPDGAVYVTDSTALIVWKLSPGATALEKWLEHGDFVSLQGIALSAEARTLHIADYANGLWSIDLATRTATLGVAPANATLFGIDGLYAARDGSLIAVQNGVAPQRILRVGLRPGTAKTDVTVLRAGHADMTDLTLGQIVGERFEFIANGGWSLFSSSTATPTARSVTILSTPL